MAGGNQNHTSFTGDEGRPPSPLGTLFLSGPFGLQVKRGLGPATSLTAFCFLSALELHANSFLSGAEDDSCISWRLCRHRPALISVLLGQKGQNRVSCVVRNGGHLRKWFTKPSSSIASTYSCSPASVCSILLMCSQCTYSLTLEYLAIFKTFFISDRNEDLVSEP